MQFMNEIKSSFPGNRKAGSASPSGVPGSAPSFRVNEIFASINGEGPLTGETAVFLRLSGCNLHCSYCDTEYARSRDQGMLMPARDIIAEIRRHRGISNVTLTGGEPLYARDIGLLIAALLDAGYRINIETNGSIDLRPFTELDPNGRIIFCCDYKLPCSGEENRMYLRNITVLRPWDALKFVIGGAADFERVAEILKCYDPRCLVYLSPVFGRTDPREIVEKMLSWAATINISRVRVQLQLHKFIWDPYARGV